MRTVLQVQTPMGVRVDVTVIVVTVTVMAVMGGTVSVRWCWSLTGEPGRGRS